MNKANNRGQALVETLISLPIMVLGVSAVIVGLHSLFLFYLGDHWTYQSSLCLAMENPKSKCQQALQRKLRMLPFCQFRVIQLDTNTRFTRAKVKIQTPFQIMQFDEKISKTLTSHHFGRAL